jgi:hypothetical protein
MPINRYLPDYASNIPSPLGIHGDRYDQMYSGDSSYLTDNTISVNPAFLTNRFPANEFQSNLTDLMDIE